MKCNHWYVDGNRLNGFRGTFDVCTRNIPNLERATEIWSNRPRWKYPGVTAAMDTLRQCDGNLMVTVTPKDDDVWFDYVCDKCNVYAFSGECDLSAVVFAEQQRIDSYEM